MTEQTTDFSKIWSGLSPITREICQTIGPVPIGLGSFQEMFEGDSVTVLKELKDRGLIEERTLKEELEEKAKGITPHREKQLIQPVGPTPKLSDPEKTALSAKRALDEYDKSTLNEKRLKLTPNFGEFVDSQE